MAVVPMKLGLTDPSWDLIDPTPDIYAMFENFNQIFFYGALDSVEVKWSNRMTTCAGVCSYEGNGGLCSVRLSAPLLKLRPRRDLVETLLHEMIHAYLFVTSYIRDRDGHGEEFQRHMNRINAAAGTKISIYHDFQAEVQLYKVHVWHCNGPCRFSHPFYGTVRRAKNRAPGPNDRWFKTHARVCTGFFTKELGGPPKIERKKTQNNGGDIRRYMLTRKPVGSEENDNPAKYSTVTPFNGKGHKLGGRNWRVTSNNLSTITRPSSTITRPSSNSASPSSNSASPSSNSASHTRNGTTGRKPRRKPANSGTSVTVSSPLATLTSPTLDGTGRKSRRKPVDSSNSVTVSSPSSTFTSHTLDGTRGQKSRRKPANSGNLTTVTGPTFDGTWQELPRSGNLATVTSSRATSTSPVFNGTRRNLGRRRPVGSGNSVTVTSSSGTSTIPTFDGTGWKSGGTTVIRPLAAITQPSATITRPSTTITQPSATMTSMTSTEAIARPATVVTGMTATEAYHAIARPSTDLLSMSPSEAYNAIARPPTDLFSISPSESFNAITRPSAIVTNMTAIEAYNAYADSITSAISVPLQRCDSWSSLQGVSVFKATSGTLDSSVGTAAVNDTFACQNYEKSLARSVSDNTGRRLGSKYPEASKASHEMFHAVSGSDKYGRMNGMSVDRVTDARLMIPHDDLAVVPLFDVSAGPSGVPFIPLDESASFPFADAPAGTSSGYRGDHAPGSSQRMPEFHPIANVECPICGQSVTIGSINYHIDSNCTKGIAFKDSLHDEGTAYKNGEHNDNTADGLDDVSTFERGEDGTYRKCRRNVDGTNDYVATNKRNINGDDAVNKRIRYDFDNTRGVTDDLFTSHRDGGMSSKACYICNRKFNNREMLIAHEQHCMSALFPDQVAGTDIGIAMVPEMDTGPQMTVCPNCGAPVPFSTINAHLDLCLLV